MLSAFAQRFGPRLGLAREFLAGPLDPNREATQTNNENILTIVSQTRYKILSTLLNLKQFSATMNLDTKVIQSNYTNTGAQRSKQR